MFKLFPSSRRHGDKAPLLVRSKDLSSNNSDANKWINNNDAANKRETSSVPTNLQSERRNNNDATMPNFNRAMTGRSIVSNRSSSVVNLISTTNEHLALNTLATMVGQRHTTITTTPLSDHSSSSNKHHRIAIAAAVHETMQSILVVETEKSSRNNVTSLTNIPPVVITTFSSRGRSSSKRYAGRDTATLPLEKTQIATDAADCVKQRQRDKKKRNNNQLVKHHAEHNTTLKLFSFLSKAATIVIQTCYRRYSARLNYYYIIRLQCDDHGRQTRSALHHISATTTAAAMTIQRIWRGHNLRLCDIFEMQRMIRLWETKKRHLKTTRWHFEVSLLKRPCEVNSSSSQDGVERQDAAAAVEFQRMWRGFTAAMSYSHLYFIIKLMPKMQAIVRIWLSRRKVDDVRTGKDIFYRLMQDRTNTNNNNIREDDNDSFDIREADEVWLDSFESIDILADEVVRERSFSSNMGLHPIEEEGDDETESPYGPIPWGVVSPNIVVVDCANIVDSIVDGAAKNIELLSSHDSVSSAASSKNTCVPSIKKKETNEECQYEDPPMYSDDWSIDPCLCHSVHQDEQDNNINHKFTSSSHLEDLMMDPVSPPLLTRTVSVKGQTRDYFGANTHPFPRSSVSPPPLRSTMLSFSSTNSCTHAAEQISSRVSTMVHDPLLPQSSILQGIASKYQKKLRNRVKSRNLSDGALHESIGESCCGISTGTTTTTKYQIIKTAESKERSRSITHSRSLSDNTLPSVVYLQQGPKKAMAESHRSHSNPSPSLTAASESPTSVNAGTAFLSPRVGSKNDPLKKLVESKLPSSSGAKTITVAISRRNEKKHKERLETLKVRLPGVTRSEF